MQTKNICAILKLQGIEPRDTEGMKKMNERELLNIASEETKQKFIAYLQELLKRRQPSRAPAEITRQVEKE